MANLRVLAYTGLSTAEVAKSLATLNQKEQEKINEQKQTLSSIPEADLEFSSETPDLKEEEQKERPELTQEEVMRKKRHNQMLLQGQYKFETYVQKRITECTKNGTDLFAEVTFESKEWDTLKTNPEVKAYLAYNPELKFEASENIYSIEHDKGIGELDKKGNKITPQMLTLSNRKIEEINWADYGVDIEALLKKYELGTIRLGGILQSDSKNTTQRPVLSYHLSSGPEKKDTRRREHLLIEDIELALLKKHPFVYTGGDGQVNKIIIGQDGKIATKNGRMIANKEMEEVLDGITRVKITEHHVSDPTVKQRHAEVDGVFIGLTTVSNQQNKTEGDGNAKMSSETVAAIDSANVSPNSKILDNQILPPEGSEGNYATGNRSSDHNPVVVINKMDGETWARIFSGGILQEGFKKFLDPHSFLNDKAFVKGKVSNEYLRADARFTAKFYALLVSNLVRAKIQNPKEKPRVDDKAIKTANQKTSLGYMEEFFNSLAEININPLKSSDEILARINFEDKEQMSALDTALENIGMKPIESSAHMREILEDAYQDDARRLCIALNNMGIDAFKSAEDILSTYASTNRTDAKKLAEAVNKILQVQAVDDLNTAQEEKKGEAHAAFTHELRQAFRNSVIELQDSDEFDTCFFPYANEDYLKAHGYVRKLDMVPEELCGDIEKIQTETFAKNADKFLEFANGKSPTGSRSPLQQLFQTMFGRELAGGFVIVAGKTPTSEEVVLAVIIENSLEFFRVHANGNSIVINPVDVGHVDTVTLEITETTTKGLADQAKNGTVGELYAKMIKGIEKFYGESRKNELDLQSKQEQTAEKPVTIRVYSGGGNRYASFSPPASPKPVPDANVPQQEHTAQTGLAM